MTFKNQINNIKKDNWIKILIVSIIAGIISIILGIFLGFIFGLFKLKMSDFHLIFQILIWMINVFISYSISYLIGKLYKVKFSFFNLLSLFLSYTISVIMVILISGNFDLLYVTTYLSIVSLGTIICSLFKYYKSKHNFYFKKRN